MGHAPVPGQAVRLGAVGPWRRPHPRLRQRQGPGWRQGAVAGGHCLGAEERGRGLRADRLRLLPDGQPGGGLGAGPARPLPGGLRGGHHRLGLDQGSGFHRRQPASQGRRPGPRHRGQLQGVRRNRPAGFHGLLGLRPGQDRGAGAGAGPGGAHAPERHCLPGAASLVGHRRGAARGAGLPVQPVPDRCGPGGREVMDP